MYNITIRKANSNRNFTTAVNGTEAAWEAYYAAVTFAEMITDTYVELWDAETGEVYASTADQE